MLSKTLFAIAASLSTASAVNQGFNYGATNADGSYRVQADFQAAFEAANSLVGTSGFTSARLYTMIQGSTTGPTSAIPAAIASDTTLLLGLWASGGAAGFAAELNALKTAITQYGSAFTSRVVGISVGSEDLYRNSPTGIAAKAGYGANPADLVDYIKQVRDAISGTALSGASIGHVDTWTSWVNGSNNAVAEALDWVGMDAYPYFQDSEANGVSEGKSLFNAALAATQSATGKTVWVTETGWPVTGATAGDGVPSTANAKTYWDDVGCPNFGKINMYWYTLQDQNAAGSVTPSFGIVGSTLSTTPLFDLSCSNTTSSSSSTASASASSKATSGLASSLASAATGGSVASAGSGLSPSGMGAGISSSAVSGAAAPTGTGSAGSSSGGSTNGTYTASTLRSASGSSATGTSTSGSSGSGSGSSGSSSSPSSSTGGAASLTGSVALALGAVFAVAAAL
ncbi:3bb111ba-e939-4fb8-baf5-a77a386910da [Sclerotinia trifoliorum]|uniref:Probable glucan endo-1,3-beta-glucosidase eglC n=1 Tax=Sclerotinia trifoliorum TaxID=28548 RepID=A0A8H2VUW0_9HELO|nr:3bb111ba-e939-4fb8-baf5-a77a386910da [Sclerotinia trifoliorum]